MNMKDYGLGFTLYLSYTALTVFAQPPGFASNPGTGPNSMHHNSGAPPGFTPLNNSPRNDIPFLPPNWAPLPQTEYVQRGTPPAQSTRFSPVQPSNSQPLRSTRKPQSRRPGDSKPKQTSYHDIQIPNIKYHHTPTFDYANALAKSMLFYEAQRSGPLPYDHRIPWRGSSAVNDGSDVGIDLTGGYYDGGGYIKYGFPMAYTATVLSWGVIRYRRTYEAIGQLEHALKTIKWATDYFIKCKRGPREFYGQVSDQQSDSSYNGDPESMTYPRKSYVLNQNKPGSEIVAETAAAMAAASIVFSETDRRYSEILIHHALDLYDFAAKYRGDYQKSIKAVDAAYRSHSGYKDELAWAAAWIYRSTGDTTYLQKAKRIYKSAGLRSMGKLFSWDDKKVGVQLLLAELTKGKQYKESVEKFCSYCLPTGKAKYTPKGLLYVPVANWGSLRYAANAAFICHLASELDINPDQYRLFALKQLDYMLGSTGRSFVVGFGENPPRKYYHKASYCPDASNSCPAFSSNFDNAHVLYGALVGGPSETDQYGDKISDRQQSSVALDYNAGFQSALAAVLDLHIYGRNNRPKLDEPGELTKTKGPAALTENGVTEGKPTYDYAQALRYSLLFYEAQRSGRLPVDNRIPWRSDSALYDGRDVHWDLTGGYYDGGDYVKYTFPLAFSMTMLSWGLIEFSDTYFATESHSHTVDAILWGADYLLKAYAESDGVVVIQVGDTYYESGSWDRPEYIDLNASRPVTYATRDRPSSEVAAEMSAAFAAMSIAVRNITSDEYNDRLIGKAKSLFRFASTHRGSFSSENSRSERKGPYDSTGYDDELVWAALWIYKATLDSEYLNYAKSQYNNEQLLNTPKTFSYDDKRAGLHLLFAEETFDASEIEKFCDRIISEAKNTPKGLFYEGLPPTKHAGNVAFLLLLMSQKFSTHPNANRWKYYARDQINYILGSTGQSFMVGYGNNYPQQPFHKSSSCPLIPLPCGDEYKHSAEPNPQILFGAVIAGPDKDDNFQDSRTRKKYTAVSLDTNAGVQSSLAALYSLQQKGLLNGSARFSSLLGSVPISLSIIIVLLGHAIFHKICNF